MQAWREQVANFVISKLHRDVSGRLEAMGISHLNEHVTEDGLFSIDIALLDQELALEVDGPFHFAFNTKAPLGKFLDFMHTKRKAHAVSTLRG